MAQGTRDRMVASAAVLLRQEGVRGTSFGRVLEHSGAPRGSVGHHFPGGKRELIAAALERAGMEVTSQLRGRPGARSTDLIAGLCDFFITGLRRSGYRSGCPVAAIGQEVSRDAELREAAADLVVGWVDLIASTLRDEGRDARTAEELGVLCVTSIEGALVLARLRESTQPLEAVRSQLLRVLGEPDGPRGPDRPNSDPQPAEPTTREVRP